VNLEDGWVEGGTGNVLEVVLERVEKGGDGQLHEHINIGGVSPHQLLGKGGESSTFLSNQNSIQSNSK